MDFPLTYTDAITVIIVGFITTFAVQRSQNSSLRKVLDTVRRAGEGNIDIRVELKRRDMVGELANEIDTLLARRASEACELVGIAEEFERYKANLELWSKTGFRLVSLSEFETVVRETANSVLRLSGAEEFLLYLTPPITAANQTYHMSAIDGQVRQLEQYRIDPAVKRAMTETTSLHYENVEHDDEYNQAIRGDFGVLVKSTMVTPLVNDGEIVGAIQLINKPDRFDQYDIDRLEFLAGFVIAALNRSR